MNDLPLLSAETMASFAARGFLRFDAAVPEDLNRQFLEEMGDIDPPRPGQKMRRTYGEMLARAGVPLGGPTPPAVRATPSPPAPRSLAARQPAADSGVGSPATAAVPVSPPSPAPAAVVNRTSPAAATEPGVWTLDADQGVSPAAAELAPDGTRSVLSAGGAAPSKTAVPAEPADRSGPAVTQPPVELLPTPNPR